MHSVVSLLVMSIDQLTDTTDHCVSDFTIGVVLPFFFVFSCESIFASISDKELKWIR